MKNPFFIFLSLLMFSQALFIAEPKAQANSAKFHINTNPVTARVGLVTPKVQMPMSRPDAPETVSKTLITYLTGSSVEIVPLNARLPGPIEAEAKAKGCGYILYITLTQKKKKAGNGGGLFGRVLNSTVSSASSNIPHKGGIAASTARSTATTESQQAAAKIAASIRAEDELSLEYKLYAAGAAATRLSQTVKAKAKQDGEDILSPLVEKAATALLNEVTQR